jgi:hypothetical protein
MKKNNDVTNLNEQIILMVKKNHPETIKQLVELVQQQHNFPKQKILEHILNLQKQGQLTLKEEKTYLFLSLQSFLLSTHSYWYWFIIILAFATTISVFIIPENAVPLVYARYLLGAVFIVFLPGYSLIKVLFPAKEIDNIERTALSIGMSLALVPLMGLLLNFTPWGIRTNPITLSLLALTTILATAAIIREYQTKTSNE